MAEKRAADNSLPTIASDEEEEPPAKRVDVNPLKYDNIMGRDAIAHFLGIYPSERDMQLYTARTRSRGDLFLNNTDHPAIHQMVLLRQLIWTEYFPSTEPRRYSPEYKWPLCQLDMPQRLMFLSVTGVLQCVVDPSNPDEITMRPDTPQNETHKHRITSEPGVLFMHGDLRGTDKYKERLEERLAQVRDRMGWDERMQPNPEDYPADEYDLLPQEFFPDSDSIASETDAVHETMEALLAEGGMEKVEDMGAADVFVVKDWRTWFARSIAIDNSAGKMGSTLTLALFRAIGITLGVTTARRVAAEVYCGVTNKVSAATRRALINLVGQTFFPSIYFNLEDLCPHTLHLTDIPDNGIEWCF